MQEPKINAIDRLGFTLFIAIALHAALILGMGFSPHSDTPSTSIKPITVSIRNERTRTDADFLAQSNQKGSGSLDDPAELTTTLPLMLGVNGRATDQHRSSKINAQQTPAAWRQSTSMTLVAQSIISDDISSQLMGEGALMTQIEQLEARLHELQQNYAKRPRVRTLTSVATQASADAAYLEQWRQHVEYIGNREYPQQAKERRLFGELRMRVSVASNGNIVDIQLLKSSGTAILDSAAVEIVHKAAPFEPFPDSIKTSTDQLDIIRTWRFEPFGQLATE